LLSEITMRLRAAEITLDQEPGHARRLGPRRRPHGSWRDQQQATQTTPRHLFHRRPGFPFVYDRDKPQQISDTSAIEAMIDEVIAANPAQVAQFKGGKRTVAASSWPSVMRLRSRRIPRC